jgi:hypothetical protein
MRPIALASGAGQMPSGQQELGRERVWDLARQPYGRAAQGEQAPPRLGDAEACALAGHADVGGLKDLGSAGDRRTLDRRDERLAQTPPLEKRVDDGQIRPSVAERIAGMAGRHRLQVGTRAEGPAGAGEHAHTDLWIIINTVPCLTHDIEHRPG